MYVLVRTDLSVGQQLAQTAHVAAEYAARHSDSVLDTPTMVVLSVRDEQHLLDHANRVNGYLFFEPDLGDTGEHTAFAAVCDGRLFSSLSLAGGKV